MSIALRQTGALFLDAYRELNARKLFWVTLIISLVVVGAFACVGIEGRRLVFLNWTLDQNAGATLGPPAKFYKMLFVAFGVEFWLAWIAMILALISSASIFPDFVSSGAIELSLSKPISRLRLYLTKYATGLLFTAIQVGVFSLACFLLIGIRGGSWEPSVLLAIPIITGVFSFLFCVCALLGVVTRSTIASLLLTLLFWFFVFLMNAASGVVLNFATMNELARERLPQRIAQWEKTAANIHEKNVRESRELALYEAKEQGKSAEGLAPPDAPVPAPTTEQLDAAYPRLARARVELKSQEANATTWRLWVGVGDALKFALPKTQEARGLLHRFLLKPGDFDMHGGRDDDDDADMFMGLLDSDRREVARRVEEKMRAKPLWWVLGTSFGFEAVVLGIGAWIFTRKEF